MEVASRRLELLKPREETSNQSSKKQSNVKEVDKREKLAVRFEIKLQKSTDDYCPEISYTDLLIKHERKIRRQSRNSSHSDITFGSDNAEDLELLAKRMEEKYGKSYGGGNRFVDLGEGYDSDDSFIDNHEAYDELVPATLTTKYGGFYINSGKLDFKEVSDDEIITEKQAKKSLNKKRRKIVSSDDESANSRTSKTSKTVSTMNAKKKVKDAQQTLIAAKKRKLLSASSASDSDKNRQKKKSLKKKKLIESAPVDESTRDNKAKLYDSVIDDVLKGMRSTLGSGISAAQASDSNTADSKSSKEPPKLPEGLPQSLLKQISDFKEKVEGSADEKNAVKFFTPELNEELLLLDTSVKQLPSQTKRTQLYLYLSQYMPINKDSLLKRMKQLRYRNLNNKLHQPLQQLKQAIDEVMPTQIEAYKQEVLKHKAQENTTDTEAKGQTEAQSESKAEDTQDSEDEDMNTQASCATEHTEGGEQQSASSAQPTKKKRDSRCRKKFSWTDRIRELLCDVVTIKMDGFEMIKSVRQTADEYIKEFLEGEVRTLWPKGWMQSRTLYNQSRKAHQSWTNPHQHQQQTQSQSKASTSQPKAAAKMKPPLMASALKMAATMVSTKSPSIFKVPSDAPDAKSPSEMSHNSNTTTKAVPTSTSSAKISKSNTGATKTIQSNSSSNKHGQSNINSNKADPFSDTPNKVSLLNTNSKKLGPSGLVSANKTGQPNVRSSKASQLVSVKIGANESGSARTEQSKFVVLHTSGQNEVQIPPAGTVTAKSEVTPTLVTNSKGSMSFLKPDGTKVKLVLTSGLPSQTTNKLSVTKPSLDDDTLIRVSMIQSRETEGNKSKPAQTHPLLSSSLTTASTSKHKQESKDDAIEVVTVYNNSPSSSSSQDNSNSSPQNLLQEVSATRPSTSNRASAATDAQAKNFSVPIDIIVAKHQQQMINKQKLVQQNTMVTAKAVLQTAEVLKKQHMAASLASQQAMLQHKQLAETLMNQTSIVKQKQIAAIAKEHNIQSEMAAKKRMATQAKLTQQRNFEQLKQTAQKQAMQNAVHRQLASRQLDKYSQALAHAAASASSGSPCMPSPTSLSSHPQTRPQSPARTPQVAHQGPTSSLTTHSGSGSSSSSPSTHQPQIYSPNLTPYMVYQGSGLSSPSLLQPASPNSWPAHLSPQQIAEYQRQLEARNKAHLQDQMKRENS